METKVAVVMGSKSDWPLMQESVNLLKELGISVEAKIISAHRMPDELSSFAKQARQKGYAVIIAGAGGAAHLPGMLAANTALPVIGVPVPSKHLQGMDSLLSIVQMPAGIPVATMAIGKAGAKNAALYAASILSDRDPIILQALEGYRKQASEAAIASQEEIDADI
ncbi:5-(carboxyamino)imidazole ribonucleotide mutase [Eupransor demetentiae]|uniref:N5-carboxyaminoimidazole ribonucleotide mutase n=1 Tax=Eupransor demetentiae TaxID=3109584 RepID=A0ABM9N444_9LACO|nr:Phosphoribosylcarboxyaminoimidazole (NCAIR) mutase (PurE) [Lactobacillaceae bacterium LMG 33000]